MSRWRRRLLAEFLRTLSGSIVLVGHSYGGNVISTAAIGNDQVKALVYFNGWMCDEGESQAPALHGRARQRDDRLLLEKFEGSLVGPSIKPVSAAATQLILEAVEATAGAG